MKPFALMPPLSFAVFYTGVLIAVAFYPGWNPFDYTLSDLGSHNSPDSAIIFNAGCWLSGIILALGGIGKAFAEKGLNRIAGIVLTVSGIGLFALGFATCDYPEIHDTDTYVIFLSAIASMAVATISDARDRDWLVVCTSIAIAVLMLILNESFSGAIGETVLISGAFAWSVIQVYKYHKNED